MTRERRSSPQTLLLLSAFLERPRAWRHGYELSSETRLKSGTIYPVLMRLTDRGFLDSRPEPSELPGRPPRRLYRLTTSGLAFARAELIAAEQLLSGAHPLPGRG
jgi:PadR family transcriptional regulator PadR